jgi:HEAT repeat protein
MNDIQPGVSASDLLEKIASGDGANFTLYFARLRKMFPDEVAQACLVFIASHDLDDPPVRFMALWLSQQGRYADILFEADALEPDASRRALAVLKTVDPYFIPNFLKATDRISSPRAILRALRIVPGLGDYSILIPWLRKLSAYPDERVKSRSVKLLCELRPSNMYLVDRQMQSADPRVRANTLEALWRSRTPEALAHFKSAASDLHHRVAGNALVGLYLQGDPSALDRMIELSNRADLQFQAAMAWSLGFTHDERTVPVLEVLSKAKSARVRNRALASLLALQSDKGDAQE